MIHKCGSFLALLLVLATTIAHSQTIIFPLDIGDRWRYTGESPYLFEGKSEMITVIDTIRIGGFQYNEIVNSGASSHEFRRQQGDSVFEYVNGDPGGRLLFKFSLSQGDTVIRFARDLYATVDRYLHRKYDSTIFGIDRQVWEFVEHVRNAQDSTKYIIASGLGLIQYQSIWYLDGHIEDASWALEGAFLGDKFHGSVIDTATGPIGEVVPISSRREWTYSYSNQSYNMGRLINDSGLVTYTIVDSTQFHDQIGWNLRAHLIGTRVATNYLGNDSTTATIDSTTNGYLLETTIGNHLLAGDFGFGLYFSSNAAESAKVYRYQIVDTTGHAHIWDEPLVFSSFGGDYSFSFSKDSGLTLAQMHGWNDAGYGSSLKLRLITSTINGVGDKIMPASFVLSQNYPNPFNPSTNFEFMVANSELVTLKVYNVLGQEVATLVDGIKPTGQYTVTWNAGGNPSGVYFYKLTAGKHTETKKLVLVR